MLALRYQRQRRTSGLNRILRDLEITSIYRMGLKKEQRGAINDIRERERGPFVGVDGEIEDRHLEGHRVGDGLPDSGNVRRGSIQSSCILFVDFIANIFSNI